MQDTLSEGTARATQLAPSAVTASAVGGSANRSVVGRVSPTTSAASNAAQSLAPRRAPRRRRDSAPQAHPKSSAHGLCRSCQGWHIANGGRYMLEKIAWRCSGGLQGLAHQACPPLGPIWASRVKSSAHGLCRSCQGWHIANGGRYMLEKIGRQKFNYAVSVVAVVEFNRCYDTPPQYRRDTQATGPTHCTSALAYAPAVPLAAH
jgi:hypothetical protein